jgi:F0F1-type ATP synthase delta subunit
MKMNANTIQNMQKDIQEIKNILKFNFGVVENDPWVQENEEIKLIESFFGKRVLSKEELVSMAEYHNIDETKLSNSLENLRKRGEIYECRVGEWKLL